jgi:DNA gyrase inhibitor GyrI
MDIRLERLKTMLAVHTHVLSDTPEEDAGKRIQDWARSNGLFGNMRCRLFGRNTYPTDNPESHGYEFYLTIQPAMELTSDMDTGIIPGGLFAVLRFKNLERMGEAWKKMWRWIEANEHEYVGWTKGDYGWVNGFEEHINWQTDKPITEWIFDLWVHLKEESSTPP